MADGSNGYGKVATFVAEISEHLEALLSLQMTYMADAKRERGLINDIKKRAKAEGIPTKELNAVLKTLDLERKVERIRDDMEEENQVTYDLMMDALGDYKNTPLGAAALEKAPKKGRGSALDSLTA